MTEQEAIERIRKAIIEGRCYGLAPRHDQPFKAREAEAAWNEMKAIAKEGRTISQQSYDRGLGHLADVLPYSSYKGPDAA